MAEAATFNAQASLMLLLRQVGVMVGLAAAVALGLYVALWARQPEYSVLFADLQDRDLNQVIEQLTSNNIPYRMDPNGGTVLVPADNLMTARMKLAGAGLAPTSSSKGAGFEALNSEQPFGTSQFLEQARYQHAIEGELSRSISHITNVRSARVHIAMPKQSAFARTKRDPSASVIVDLFNGRQLERHQVAAIAQMVSAAVAGMPVNKVTVIDQRGNLLTDNGDRTTAWWCRPSASSTRATSSSPISIASKRSCRPGRARWRARRSDGRSRFHREPAIERNLQPRHVGGAQRKHHRGRAQR